MSLARSPGEAGTPSACLEEATVLPVLVLALAWALLLVEVGKETALRAWGLVSPAPVLV